MVYKLGSVIRRTDYRFEWVVSNRYSELCLMHGEIQSPSFCFANASFMVFLKEVTPRSSQLNWIQICVKTLTPYIIPRVQVKLGIVGNDGKDHEIRIGDANARGEFWSLLVKGQMVNEAHTIFCELRKMDGKVHADLLLKARQSKKDYLNEKDVGLCRNNEVQVSKSEKLEPWNSVPQRFLGGVDNWLTGKVGTPELNDKVQRGRYEEVSWSIGKTKRPGIESNVKPANDDDLFSSLEKVGCSKYKSSIKPTEDDDLFHSLEKVGCLKSKININPEEDDDLFSSLEKVGCPKSKSNIKPEEDGDLFNSLEKVGRLKYKSQMPRREAADPWELAWGEDDLELFREKPKSQPLPRNNEDPLRLVWIEEDLIDFSTRSEVQPANKADDKGVNSSIVKIETPPSRDEVQSENIDESKDAGACSVERGKAFRSKGIDKVLQGLKELLESEEQSDVTLKLKGKCFKAHKLILRMRSPVFYSMFEHDMVEKETGEVKIDDCDPETFPDFLSYLYTGSVDNISADNAFSLYSIADKYCVDEMKEDCVERMKNTLSVDTFFETLTLALKYNEQELIEDAILFFNKEMKKIILTPKWQLFMHEHSITANELLIKTLMP